MKRLNIFAVTFIVFHLSSIVYGNDYESSIQKIQNLQAEEAQTIIDVKHTTQLMSHGQKTKYVLLSLPGLHESPFHLQGLNNFFFDEGANVLSLHLPGHNQQNEKAIHKVKAEEWSKAVAHAIDLARGLGEKLIILGYSTGGGLAIEAALERPHDVSQIYLVAPSMALSTKVFFFTAFGKPLSQKKLCDIGHPGFLCKVFQKLDPQAIQMMKEGTYPSAAAGTQVQQLVNNMMKKYGDSDGQDYFQQIEGIYSQLKVPTFLISSEADTITSPTLNRRVFKRLKVKKEMVEYPKDLKISHLMISKSKTDAFPSSPEESYNPHFEELTTKMRVFWKGQ